MARYRLGRRLAAGGMAEVFVGDAVGAGGFSRPVAIKRVLPHLAHDVAYQALFLREARRMAAVQHRNVVQVLDLGAHKGVPCMVLELVDGENLRTFLKAATARGRALSLAEALYLTTEVAEGLAHAHASCRDDGAPLGLVHRDINPTNILVAATGEVKLADFGVAWAADGEAHEEGVVKGKPGYLAPEQARGEIPSQRADVFLLGLLLHELLTGERLFQGLSFAQALTRVRAFRPELMRRPEAVPAPLWELTCRALEPEAPRRLDSARHFADTLRACARALGAWMGPIELAATFRVLFPSRPSLLTRAREMVQGEDAVALELSWQPTEVGDATPALEDSVPFLSAEAFELLEDDPLALGDAEPFDADALSVALLDEAEDALEPEAEARIMELLDLDRRRRGRDLLSPAAAS